MLPLSLRKDYLSFTDYKWEFRYQTDQEGLVTDKNPKLYELMPTGDFREHICKIGET